MDSKDTRQIRAQKLAAGIKKHLNKAKTVTFGGVEHKTADIIDAIQAAVDATEDCTTKKAAYHAAVDVEANALEVMNPLALGLRTYLYLTYGNSAAILADFGLSPRTRKAPTVETKAKAADKMRATREARGTKGKRQREEIVVGSTPAETSDASASSTATPAAPAAAPAVARPAAPSN